MEIKEKNFFKKIWTSIRDFEGYEEFAAGKASKAIQYMLLITLIFTVIIAIAFTYKFYSSIQKISNYIDENISDIKVENGKLEIEPNELKVIESEDNIIPLMVIIPDNEEQEKQIEEYRGKIKALNANGIIFLEEKAILISSALNTEQSIEYSNLFESDIEGKKEILDLLGNKMLASYGVIFFLSLCVYLYVVYFMSNIIDAIVLGVLGYLFAKIMGLRLKYKATFNIGVYALTLPIILNLIYIIVNTFTGFEIDYFQWMYTTISYIYVVVAILMIKTEILNQRIQLIKLKEIQNQISEEDEIPKEESDKNEEEEKKEEKDDETTSGEEPEGSKA